MTLGAFDAYVQEGQETAMRNLYQKYCDDNDPADVLSFEDFCEWQEERKGEL